MIGGAFFCLLCGFFFVAFIAFFRYGELFSCHRPTESSSPSPSSHGHLRDVLKRAEGSVYVCVRERECVCCSKQTDYSQQHKTKSNHKKLIVCSNVSCGSDCPSIPLLAMVLANLTKHFSTHTPLTHTHFDSIFGSCVYVCVCRGVEQKWVQSSRTTKPLVVRQHRKSNISQTRYRHYRSAIRLDFVAVLV